MLHIYVRRCLRRLTPQHALSRALVLTLFLWIAWFLLQIYTVGQAAYDEVIKRLLQLSYHTQIYTVKQLEAFRVLWLVLENFGRLVAPFVVDVVIFLTDLLRALPPEAQFGLVGVSAAIYGILYSRILRHILFLPVSVLLWFGISYIPLSIAQLLLPLICLVIPAGSSLYAFSAKQRKACGFWISYWFLFPIMQVCIHFVRKTFPLPTSSSGLYWRVQCIVSVWLVLWGGSDLACSCLLRVFLGVWSWLSKRGLFSTVINIFFSFKTQAQGLRHPDLHTTWKIRDKLGQIMSLGKNALILSGIAAVAVLLVMYKLLSVVSAAIVWPWFLYELGSTVHRKTKALYRGKIALALLFLLADWIFKQTWFLVPTFVLDFIRIPIILLLNMCGEMVLDALLSIVNVGLTDPERPPGPGGNVQPIRHDDRRPEAPRIEGQPPSPRLESHPSGPISDQMESDSSPVAPSSTMPDTMASSADDETDISDVPRIRRRG